MTTLLRFGAATALLALLAGAASAQTPTTLPAPAPAATPAAPTSPPAPAAAKMAPDPAAAPLLGPSQVPGKYKAYLYQRYAADRKALAVVRLFARRQTGGALFVAGGAVLVGSLAALNGTHDAGGGTKVIVDVSPVAYLLFGGPLLGVGVGKLSRFSNRRLYEALADYERTGTLPNYVQGRLRERDY